MTIEFPIWVKTTHCHTRTFSVVATGGTHGAEKREGTFANMPLETVVQKDGRRMTKWTVPSLSTLRGMKRVY